MDEEKKMTDTERQIEVIKRIIDASDDEMNNIDCILDLVRIYGITPLPWLQELDNTIVYTENGMIQVPDEFALFCKMLSSEKIDTAIEIGVYRGRSSYFMCALLYRNNPSLRYDMVDICDSLDEFEEFAKVLPCLNKCIPGTSKDYVNQQYDFVFIDADHSYEGAMADYLNVGRHAKRMVCFHDIYAHEYDSLSGGIVRCWEEVCTMTPNHMKMVFSQFPNRWMGIGVIVNDDRDKTIGYEGDYEKIEDNVTHFIEEIFGYDKVFIYGARNDSRRMYDALSSINVNVCGLVIESEEENPEGVTSYPVYKLRDVIDEDNMAVVVCFREKLRTQATEMLKNYAGTNIIYTNDLTASFIR